MSKYVIDLLTNSRKYEIFSNNARRRAIELFGIDKIVPYYENYYQTVLEEKVSA